MRKKCSYPLEPSRLCKGQDNLRKENQTDRLWRIVTVALGRIGSSAMIPQPWGNCFRLCKSRGASLSRWPLSRLLWMSRSWAECEKKARGRRRLPQGNFALSGGCIQRINAFELWCWRRLLRVPWTARRSNQSIPKDLLQSWRFI